MSRKQEEVLDSWEEIDEAQLTAKINKMREHSSKEKNSRKMTILAVEDDPRSHFGQYGPQEPTLKILKRPQDTEGRTGGDNNRPKAPVKSLQQREQEYAEARLRILGSAKSPEEEQNNSVMRRGSESGGSSSRQTMSSVKTPDGLIRLPRGPDGTSGFTLKR